jgi:hypothetical protein
MRIRLLGATVLTAGLIGLGGAPAMASGLSDLYNCDDFSSQEEAQATFEASDDSDPNGLDDDDDGVACETLPSNGGEPVGSAPLDDIILYCSDLESPEAAQAELDGDPGQAATLDPNGNGVACDSSGEVQTSNLSDDGDDDQMVTPKGGVDAGAGGLATDTTGLYAAGGALALAGAGGLVLLRRRAQD